ncbi:MAG: hypothetical protein KDI44_19430 [Thiothrix sp.]|nr:hypothetical protein [Thiothrix sp.]
MSYYTRFCPGSYASMGWAPAELEPELDEVAAYEAARERAAEDNYERYMALLPFNQFDYLLDEDDVDAMHQSALAEVAEEDGFALYDGAQAASAAASAFALALLERHNALVARTRATLKRMKLPMNGYRYEPSVVTAVSTAIRAGQPDNWLAYLGQADSWAARAFGART